MIPNAPRPRDVRTALGRRGRPLLARIKFKEPVDLPPGAASVKFAAACRYQPAADPFSGDCGLLRLKRKRHLELHGATKQPDGQITKSLSSPSRKIFRFRVGANQ